MPARLIGNGLRELDLFLTDMIVEAQRIDLSATELLLHRESGRLRDGLVTATLGVRRRMSRDDDGGETRWTLGASRTLADRRRIKRKRNLARRARRAPARARGRRDAKRVE